MTTKRFKLSKVLLGIITGYVFGLGLALCAHAQEPVNIALGKTVTFSKSPDYFWCTDPDDNKQLTDGKLANEGLENADSIWVQKGTVGWNNTVPVVITIDLGAVQPISGISYSTAAGRSGVVWPTAIYMATSDDNKTWHYAGDLVLLSQKNGTPAAAGYQTFRYVTHDLRTKGRYILFGVVQMNFVFVDEIEVYKGDDAWLAQPAPGRLAADMEDLARQMRVTSCAQHRLNDDIAAVRAAIKESAVPFGIKSTFNARLDKDAAAVADMPPLPADFKTILPLNDTHRSILAVYGELLAAEGRKPLTLWKQHRYAWLPLLARPDLANKAQLHFSMLRNQFRSDDVLLTNAGGKAQQVALRLQNPPRGAAAGWLQVYSVAWTDTAQSTPVADALLPVTAQNGAYQIDVPAGMTRKVWFTVDSSKVPAGSYKSTFMTNGNSIPVAINVSKTAMNTPRFSMGMWDYTNNTKKPWGITVENRQATIEMMRSHYVDSPWANRAVLPLPAASAFDAEGNFTGKTDFSEFDHWVAMWPGARRYFVFLDIVRASFAGTKTGTPEFNVRVGSWAKVLSTHMKELRLQPKQLGILLVDEPHADDRDAIIAAWAKAINATAPELTLFQNPTWERLDQTKIQDAITQIDILCPNLRIYKPGGEPVQKYFENLRAQGKVLWLYQCSGPVRPYDPQRYYRYQSWHAFAIGATGQAFWSFGDTGGADTSWNEYSTAGSSYAPAFLDKDTVYDSIHWDAAREGVEDYEELAMLRDAIKSSSNMVWKMQAQQILDDAVKTVTGVWSLDYQWVDERNPDLADAQLQKVQAALQGF
jgi:hypothetical protein